MGGSPPTPPKAVDKQAQQAAEDAAAANRRARGYKATVLSTMMGSGGGKTSLGA